MRSAGKRPAAGVDEDMMRSGRKLLRTIVSSVVVFCCVTSAFAQAPAAEPLTIATAVELALRNHPALGEASAGAAAAHEDVSVARTAYLPRLDLLWQANRSTRNNVFGLLLPQSIIPPVSGPVLSGSAQPSVWSAAGGLLLSWEAFDFGRRGASIAVARAESAAADAERKLVELQIATRAADAFLVVAAADAASQATRANVNRLETFASTVRTLVQSQLRAGAEQSRAEAELAAARNRAIEAERDAQLARLTLAEAIGSPGTIVAIVSPELSAVPRRGDTAAFDAASHPQAAVANAGVTVAEEREHLIERSIWPRIEFQTALAGRGVSRDVNGLPSSTSFGFEVPNWAVGLQVTFPSMEVFRAQPRQRAKAERANQARARHERTVQTLQSDDARARTVIDAAYAIAANTPQQLQAARESDAQARARYAAGLTNVLEVAEGQRLLAEAEAESAVAALSVWRALLADAALRGDLQPFLIQTRALQKPADHPEE
jgi:outer membrane protein